MRYLKFQFTCRGISSMEKAQSFIGFLGIFSGLSLSRRSRRLNSEEAKLVEQYRALSENDRIAMRYLADAMHRVSRF